MAVERSSTTTPPPPPHPPFKSMVQGFFSAAITLPLIQCKKMSESLERDLSNGVNKFKRDKFGCTMDNNSPWSKTKIIIMAPTKFCGFNT